MNSFLDIAASALIILGAIVVFLGALAVVRFPDVFSRFSGAGAAGMAGMALILAGACFAAPQLGVLLRAAIILVALIGSLPLSGHAIARFAYRAGTFISPLTFRDDIAAEKAISRHGPEFKGDGDAD